MQETIRLAGDDGARLTFYVCDIGDPAAVAAVGAQILAAWGEVEVLVNAAGTNAPRRSLAELASADYHALIAANLHGAYYCTQAFLPAMRRRGNGTIINIVSDAAVGVAKTTRPLVSKFRLAGLTKASMRRTRPRIRACALFPGDIDTPLLNKRPQVPDAAARARMLRPEDVADCVLFCLGQPPHVIVEELLVRPR